METDKETTEGLLLELFRKAEKQFEDVRKLFAQLLQIKTQIQQPNGLQKIAEEEIRSAITNYDRDRLSTLEILDRWCTNQIQPELKPTLVRSVMIVTICTHIAQSQIAAENGDRINFAERLAQTFLIQWLVGAALVSALEELPPAVHPSEQTIGGQDKFQKKVGEQNFLPKFPLPRRPLTPADLNSISEKIALLEASVSESD